MKKFVLLMLVGALALSSFAACGGNEANDESKNDSKTESKVESVEASVADSADASADSAEVDLASLKEQLKSKLVATDTLDKGADELYNDTGIADTTYADYCWFSEMSGLSSETVAIFEAKSEADLETIKGFLESYVQASTNQMKDYNADNYDMLTKSVIKTSGSYVYLVISPNVGDIDSAIAAALA